MPPLCITGKFLIEYFSLAKLESLWNLTPRISVSAELASRPSNKLPFYGLMFELRPNICIPRHQAVEPSMRASRDHTNPVVLENGANGPGTKFWKSFPKQGWRKRLSPCVRGWSLPSWKASPVTISLQVGHPGWVSSLSTQGLPAEAWIWTQLYSAPWASLAAQMVKCLLYPAMWETWIQSLGWEDPLEKGNGNPLQYSCLENSMDRGAWEATVHGVAKSRTRLSDFTSLFSSKAFLLRSDYASSYKTGERHGSVAWPSSLWLPGTKSLSCLSSHQVCQGLSRMEGSSLYHSISVPLLALSPPPTWPSPAGSAQPLASLSGRVNVASAGLMTWRSLLGIFCASPPGVGSVQHEATQAGSALIQLCISHHLTPGLGQWVC